jgi:hypothetical protein
MFCRIGRLGAFPVLSSLFGGNLAESRQAHSVGVFGPSRGIRCLASLRRRREDVRLLQEGPVAFDDLFLVIRAAFWRALEGLVIGVNQPDADF